MKKKILIVVASLLLISGLTAGVFAKYQTTLDDVEGSAVAKKWQISAYTSGHEEGPIKLAPGENANVLTYTIENNSEVNAEITGNYTLDGELADRLTTTFNPIDGWTGNDFNVVLAANDSLEFTINIEWIYSEEIENDYSEKEANWKVSFLATQTNSAATI